MPIDLAAYLVKIPFRIEYFIKRISIKKVVIPSPFSNGAIGKRVFIFTWNAIGLPKALAGSKKYVIDQIVKSTNTFFI
jgi:hypothetical protein